MSTFTGQPAYQMPPPHELCRQPRCLCSSRRQHELRGLAQEDLERGYFDDFKELKDTAGKLWRSPDRLIPAEAAQPFPPIKVRISTC